MIPRSAVLRPNESTQRDALSGAVAELLWKVTGWCTNIQIILLILQCGGKAGAVVAIPGVGRVFDPPPKFNIDGVTEKVKKTRNNSEQDVIMLYLLVTSFPL